MPSDSAHSSQIRRHRQLLVTASLAQKPASIVLGLINRVKARAHALFGLDPLAQTRASLSVSSRLSGAVKEGEATATRGHEVASLTAHDRQSTIDIALWYRHSRHQSASQATFGRLENRPMTGKGMADKPLRHVNGQATLGQPRRRIGLLADEREAMGNRHKLIARLDFGGSKPCLKQVFNGGHKGRPTR
jgi:hypothetical protein